MKLEMLALAIALAITASVSAQRGWQREATQHGWQLNYGEAKELARKSGKPLMVVFRCVP